MNQRNIINAPAGSFGISRGGNFTTVASRTANIGKLIIGDLVATSATIEFVSVTNLLASNATVTNLVGTDATFTNLFSTNATITNLFSTNATITNLFVVDQTGGNSRFASLIVTNLRATNETVTNLMSTNLIATNETVTNLSATNETVTNLAGTNATFTDLFSTNQTVTNATFTDLFSTNETVTNLFATNATITNLSSSSLTGIQAYAQAINFGTTTTINDGESFTFSQGTIAPLLSISAMASGSSGMFINKTGDYQYHYYVKGRPENVAPPNHTQFALAVDGTILPNTVYACDVQTVALPGSGTLCATGRGIISLTSGQRVNLRLNSTTIFAPTDFDGDAITASLMLNKIN